jgi:hypothetical protein
VTAARLAAGLLVQPFAAAALAFLLSPLVDVGGRGPLSFALGVGAVAAVVTVLGAAPLMLWRSRRHTLELSDVILDGLLLGNAPLAIAALVIAFVGLPPAWWGPGAAVAVIAFGSFLGVMGALLFWAIAVGSNEPA